MAVLKLLGASLVLGVIAIPQALALTITNRDANPHTVMVQKGDAENEYALPAGASVEDDCDTACIVRLAGAEGEQPAQAGDRFVIQGGALQREE